MSIAYSQIFQQKQGERAPVVRHMAKYVALATSTSIDHPVLDFGCGWGYLLEALNHHGIPCEGIDISEGQIIEATKNGCKATHVVDSIEWLKKRTLNGQRWGTIFLLDVLEHLEASQQLVLLENLFQALAAGGRLVIKCPNPDSVVGMRMAYIDYTHRFTPSFDALSAALKSCGFLHVSVQDELPWSDPYSFALRPLFFGEIAAVQRQRRDFFYFLSQKFFRALRRLQIASEIGLETAEHVPLAPNFVCIADR